MINSAFNQRRKALNGRSVLAVLLLGLFLAALSLTHLETLHHALHTDADDLDHQCAVMLLKQGLLDSAQTSVAPAPHSIASVQRVLRNDTFIPSPIGQLPPGRAPPAFPA